MQSRKSFYTVCLALSVSFGACNQPFSPKAPFEGRLVVYSVLYTDRSLQFVRVSSTYDVPGYSPYSNTEDWSVAGASVSVSGSKGKYVFRDTILVRSDTTRYDSPIHAYVCDWQPEPGQTYTLSVDAGSLGQTQATVSTLPLAGLRHWYPSYVLLDDPEMSKSVPTIAAFFDPPHALEGFLQEAYIVYSIQSGDGKELLKQTYLPNSNVTTAGSTVGVWVQTSAMLDSIRAVSTRYSSSKLAFKRIVFRLFEMDHNWYDYYTVVRRVQTTTSTRFDQPDFTNLSHGFGVFGACTIDSLSHNYPSNFPFNH